MAATSFRPMATPISIANIARVAAGVVTTLWALLGLGDALAAVTARAPDGLLAFAIAAHVALLAGAAMAFAGLRRWRPVVIVAMVAVTAYRFVSVLGTGDYLLAITAVAMLVAVLAIAAVARPQ